MPSDKTVIIVTPHPQQSNEEILVSMREMKAAREERVAHVVCLLSGFGDDARDLGEIPETRAFCRRLVNLGFISYLDYTTRILCDHPFKDALGAAEIWLISEGIFTGVLEVTMDLLDRIKVAVYESNGVADAAMGPMS